MNEVDKKQIDVILHFWFEEVEPKKRFEKDEELDGEIKKRFLSAYEHIVAGKTALWRETPEGRLAEIIVLDQFTRNMFRGERQSFAGDPLALQLAKEAVAEGDDQKLSKEKRAFMYMPYMHSESKEVHKEALKLFIDLGIEENLKYEKMHKEIIDRFERYPHRNEVLGRASTPEEIAFLKDNSGF